MDHPNIHLAESPSLWVASILARPILKRLTANEQMWNQVIVFHLFIFFFALFIIFTSILLNI